MDNRNTPCDRCGRRFVGNRGLNIHRSRSRRCVDPPDLNQEIGLVARPPEQPEIQSQAEQGDDDPGFFTPEEEFAETFQIEGYSLHGITIPADLFQSLENEQQIGGRYWSLAQFAAASTLSQYQKKMGMVESFIRLLNVILLSIFWVARIVCIASMSLALYCCYKGQCYPTVHYIMGVR